MTEEARRCVESCREWYQAFSNFGKGNERSVKELLEVADLIESLSEQLEQTVTKCHQLESQLEHITRERDAYWKCMEGLCATCKHAPYCILRPVDRCKNWQWRGAEVE